MRVEVVRAVADVFDPAEGMVVVFYEDVAFRLIIKGYRFGAEVTEGGVKWEVGCGEGELVKVCAEGKSRGRKPVTAFEFSIFNAHGKDVQVRFQHRFGKGEEVVTKSPAFGFIFSDLIVFGMIEPVWSFLYFSDYILGREGLASAIDLTDN